MSTSGFFLSDVNSCLRSHNRECNDGRPLWDKVRFLRKAAGLTVVALFLAGCSADNPPETSEDASVRPVLYAVASAHQDIRQGFVGTVEPRYSTDLAFRVLGRIVQRDVNMGDFVKKDQIVAMIDPASFDLALQAAQAGAAAAEAKFDNAQANEQRQSQLLNLRSISPAMYESSKQARDVAFAEREQAQAALQKVRDQREYSQLKPDFSGVVSSINAEVGQVVAAGQSVMTIARPDIREAVVDLPEFIAENTRIGDKFQVVLQVQPDIVIDGTVREVSAQMDAVTRLRRVRISLPDAPSVFRLGTTITARKTFDDQQDSMVDLPLSALFEVDGEQFIWLIDREALIVTRQKVDVILRSDQEFSTSDIAVGSYVVIAGVHSLQPDSRVILMDEGSSR